MEMRNFILNKDILTVEVTIDQADYLIGVQWLEPEKPFADTWILKSYANKKTGEKDLSDEKISAFLNTINARWNWNV